MTPVRIQLRRVKGFNLQAESFQANGRPCVKVDRTTPFGNPFRPTLADAATCVRNFREWLNPNNDGRFGMDREAAAMRSRLYYLRGKNLACWCKPGDPCHADVLLEIANAPGPIAGKL